MSITRNRLPFEVDDDYTKVPNAWIRDGRLSRRARNILSEILSHRIGWELSEAALVNGGPEGRDAIRTAQRELVDLGYLVKIQKRDKGKFAEVAYELADPFEPVDNSGPKTTVAWKSVDGKTGDGFSAVKENHLEEDQLSQSSGTSHEGPVDNSGVTTGIHPAPPIPTPLVVASSREVDEHQVREALQKLSDGASFDDARAATHAILVRAKGRVTNPTAYVLAAIAAETFVWQAWLFDRDVKRAGLDAETAGNLF